MTWEMSKRSTYLVAQREFLTPFTRTGNGKVSRNCTRTLSWKPGKSVWRTKTAHPKKCGCWNFGKNLLPFTLNTPLSDSSRNPWGTPKHGSWQGAWSDGSKEWTPKTLEELNHKQGVDSVFVRTFFSVLLKFARSFHGQAHLSEMNCGCGAHEHVLTMECHHSKSTW